MIDVAKLVPPSTDEQDDRQNIIAQLEKALAEARDPAQRVTTVLVVMTYHKAGYGWFVGGGGTSINLMGAVDRVRHRLHAAMDAEEDD